MQSTHSVEQVFAQMQRSFRNEEAQGLDNTFQFHITGEGGGDWHAHVEWDSCEIARGTIRAPDVTITISAEDWLAIAHGQLKAETAYMTGKLQTEGDLGLATRLEPLFF